MNEKRAWGLACLVFGTWIFGATQMAQAQGYTWIGEGLTRMVDEARWRIGPLRVNAAFTLADAGYDSDIYYGYFQDDEIPDWRLAASIPVQLIVPLDKSVVLDLSDTPQYLFFADNSAERALNNTFRGQLHVSLERVYVQAGGGMADVRRRFSPELDIFVRERSNRLDGLIFWQVSRGTSFAALYSRTHFTYEDIEFMGTSLADLLNRNEGLLDLIFYSRPSPRWRPFLNGQYGTYTFTGEGADLRNAKSYGIFGGLEFVPPAEGTEARTQFRGALRLGYLRLGVADPSQPDGSGFSGEADVTIDLTRKTSIHARFSRGFEFSVYSGAVYYLSTNYGAGLIQRLSRRTSLSYEAFFGRLSYRGDETIPGRRERYSLHTLGLNLRLARHLEAVLSGTLNRREVDVEAAPRNRYFVGLSLTYGSPGRGLASPLSGLGR